MSRAARMHQTTVRFGQDLWEMIESEAAKLGVSAAHYIREATLARLAFAEGMKQGTPDQSPLTWAQAGEKATLSERTRAQIENAEALRAQGIVARRHARELRREAAATRARRRIGR